MRHIEATPHPARTSKRPPRWQIVVSAIRIRLSRAQFFAGWKFLNGETYPVVGSAMFNGPPNPRSADFLVPRVIGTTVTVSSVELDQHTFGLEPFEWRAGSSATSSTWTRIERTRRARRWRRRYSSQTGDTLASFEIWRVPALTDDYDRADLVRTVDL